MAPAWRATTTPVVTLVVAAFAPTATADAARGRDWRTCRTCRSCRTCRTCSQLALGSTSNGRDSFPTVLPEDRDDRARDVSAGRQRANGNDPQCLPQRAIGALSHFRNAALKSRTVSRIGDFEYDFRLIQRAWLVGVQLGIGPELPVRHLQDDRWAQTSRLARRAPASGSDRQTRAPDHPYGTRRRHARRFRCCRRGRSRRA